jgi:YbgC/YbaW family acyl-CoA thioester hydrolase
VLKRSDFRFLDRLRVRWAEVDLQKIVFNGHYLMYFDTAVAGYWRAMALPYHEAMERLQGDLYVRKATLEYEGSARYDDQLEIGIRCTRIGNSSLLLSAAAFRGEARLVHGELVYVFADPATQTSRPVPQALRDVLNAFEAGQAMAEVRVGSWAELGEAARAIRQAVFVDEQRIPAGLVCDEADATGVHALACNRLGMPVASGRLLALPEGGAKIGRMATLPTVRGGGLGRRVLHALMQAASARGEREVMLHAQGSAVAFYLREGYVPQGPVFEEAGVPHQEMRFALAAFRPPGG